MKDFSDPFHWILMNPVTIIPDKSLSNNSDEIKQEEEYIPSEEFINSMCGELLIEMLLEYALRESN